MSHIESKDLTVPHVHINWRTTSYDQPLEYMSTWRTVWWMWRACRHILTSQSGDPRVLTNEDWAEEEGDGDVDDRGGHVQKPVGSHGKEPQEEQKEEQAVLVLLNLGDKDEMLNQMLESMKQMFLFCDFSFGRQ